tara:strand:- start:8414 stop:9877 length:1464 start_codon:yes stop_codon:yes gene_type:complete
VSIGGSRQRWRYQEDPSAQIRVTKNSAAKDAHDSDFDTDAASQTNPDATPRVAFGKTMPAPIIGDTGNFVLGLMRKSVVLPKTGDIVAQRYRVVAAIGEGGMGQVYEVAHIRLSRSFALKLLHPSLAEDKNMCRSFFREARYASSLEHLNLVSVLDFGEDPIFGGYMVMELADGQSLKSFISKRAKLSIKKACDIVAQLAEALSYMHQNELVHCDLKPENIVLIPNETAGRRGHLVKILDFGLAQSLGGTNRDGVFGTPKYIAPEVARQEAPGPASDIYSLGILFFELITGSVPWSGDVGSVLHAQVHEAPPSLSEARGSSVDPALEQLVAIALAKDPSKRHKSMSAFVYELKNFMQMSGMRRSRRASLGTAEDETARRAKSACLGFDALHLPLATINSEGTIVAANASFSNFLLGIRVGLEGTKLAETSLASAWPTMKLDLDAALQGNSLGRRVEMTQGQSTRHLQMWLEPTSALGQVILSLYPER